MFQSDRLAALRKGKKMRQADMALHFGLERSTYGKYEQGSITPPGDMIAKLATFFEVSSDYLLGLSDIPNPASLLPEPPESSDVNLLPPPASSIEVDSLPESEDIKEFAEGYGKLDKKGKHHVMSEFFKQLERVENAQIKALEAELAYKSGLVALAQGRKLPLTSKEALKRESKSDE